MMDRKECVVMAHRYLYYVLCEPVVSDSVYDALEREARAELPEVSPVHGVGSDRASSYCQEHIDMAMKLKEQHGD